MSPLATSSTTTQVTGRMFSPSMETIASVRRSMISRFWSGVKTSSTSLTLMIGIVPPGVDWLAACSCSRRDEWLCRVVELESRGAVVGDRVSGQELRQHLSDRLGTLDLQEMADPVDRAFLDVRERGAQELGDLHPQRPGVRADHG